MPRSRQGCRYVEVHLKRPEGKIILGRHGQTLYNRDGFIMGHTDSQLVPDAIPRVRLLASMLVEERVSDIHSSTLGRAALTAAICSEVIQAPLHFRSEMRELSCGMWEGRLRREVTGDSPLLRNTWEDSPPGGESYRDGENRVSPFLEELINRLASDETALLVGHAGINRAILRLLLELEPAQAISIRCPHDMIYIVGNTGPVGHKYSTGEEGEGLIHECHAMSVP